MRKAKKKIQHNAITEQESPAIERKPRDAVAALFGLEVRRQHSLQVQE